MSISRRGFLKTAAGLLVAAVAPEILVPDRRVWALDRTMVVPSAKIAYFDGRTVPLPEFPVIPFDEFMETIRVMYGEISDSNAKTLLMSQETADALWGVVSQVHPTWTTKPVYSTVRQS